MWYRKIILAEQGMFDPKTSTGQSLKSLLENLISNSYENDVLNLEILNKKLATSELKNYISEFVPQYGSNFYAQYDLNTKKMYLKLSIEKNALISFAKHELIHGADPKLREVGPGKKFKTMDEMSQHYRNQWKKSGRGFYFDPTEVTAWRQQFDDAFNTKNLKAIYDNYYKNAPNGKDLFKKEFKQFIDTLRNFSINFDNALLEIDKKNDENPHIDEQSIKDEIFSKYKIDNKFIRKWTRMVEKTSGIPLSEAIYGIKDPKFYLNLNKYLSQKYVYLEYILNDLPIPTDPLANKTNKNQASKQKLSSDSISEETLKVVGNKVSTQQSKNLLSSALPTISKLFKQLGEFINKNLDKFNNSKTGKVFNYGMLAKDIYFIITLSDKITKQINAGEEVMMKDQLDLGLTIVSILTDQQTQAILRTIFPPIIVLLNNPQVQAWLVGINVGANVLSGAVTVSDYLGTLAGTTNKSEGATAGVQNVPGSAQALVMPVFQLYDKYGEVFNALVDNVKGMTTEQAIAKHIMKDASGGIEPYRLSLFYKFRENKDKILAYQKSPAFKKLPEGNQVLYPNATSSYAISSYKKARDARERERQEAEARRKARMPQE